MKTKSISERGQALVLIALAIIGLVGITGLAIDGSAILTDRRHAQNAADTAALAGAMAKIQAQKPISQGGLGYNDVQARAPMKTAALDRAISNGYYPDLLSSQVEVYACDETGASCPAPYTGKNNYVQVIINSNVDTFFARVLGIDQLHNRVQAIALTDDDDSGPLGNGSSITAYATDCESPDNFTISGDTQVNVTGGSGLFINTANPACGFKCDSNGPTIDANITSAGGTISLDNKCGENYTDTTSTSGSQLDFPIYVADLGLDVPTECTGPIGTYSNYPAGYNGPPFDPSNPYPGYPTEKVTVLHPGRYGQFPPPKDSPALPLNDTILMDPGVYCVSDVIRWNQPHFVLVGHDVTIYLRAGYYFSLTGGIIKLDAPDSGDYAGFLILVEPAYGNPELSIPPDNCTIAGNGNNVFTGTIFAPYCDCKLEGDGSDYGFNAQLLCYTVDIRGGGIVSFTYDPGVLGYRDDPAKTGVTR